MDDLSEYLTSGVVGVAILVVLIIWAIMTFLMPFFVFGAWRRAKQVSRNADEVVAVLRRIERNTDKERAVEWAIARTSKLAKLSERAP